MSKYLEWFIETGKHFLVLNLVLIIVLAFILLENLKTEAKLQKFEAFFGTYDEVFYPDKQINFPSEPIRTDLGNFTGLDI